MKHLVTILLILFSLTAFGSENKNQSSNDFETEYCNRTAAEVEVSKDVFEAGAYSDILVQLLSGNSKGASESLGGWLAIKVIFLGKALKENPCNLSHEKLKRVYPILRVVAAVHNKTPIREIAENEEALKTLQEAIQENPKHYKETVERSKNNK